MKMGQRAPHYATSLRLKLVDGKLLELLAKDTGLDKTAVIVLALRDLARARSIAIPQEEEGEEAGA